MREKTKTQLAQEAGTLRTRLAGVQRQLAQFKRQADRLRDEQAHSARLTAVGEMALSIVHELQQPLGSIATYTESCVRLIRAGGCDQAELIQVLDFVAAQTGYAAAFLQRLRRFLVHGEPQRPLLQINDAVREAVLLADPRLRQGQIRLELKLAQDLPPVRADPIQIQQVILNLLRNAAEALAQVPPERRRITVATAPLGTEVLTAVSDTGPGLPPEGARRLFEPFETTKPQGMGMGLTISRSILDAHGGRLWIQPNPGHGITFSFALPPGVPDDGTSTGSGSGG